MNRCASLLLALLCFALAGAQSTNGSASLMTQKQRNAVRATKYRVIVPTYVPKGFRLTQCGLTDTKETILATWSAQYRNAKTGATFTIQMTSEGMGDPMFDLPNGDVVEPTGYIKASNPILGKVDLGYYRKGKIRIANCTWYEVKAKSYPRCAMILSHGMEVSEVKRILESLRWLK